MRSLFIALLFIWCGVPPAVSADNLVRFAALSEGNEVEVKLLSLGLPGSQRAYEFTFRSSTNASVAVVRLDGPPIADLSVTNWSQLFAGLTNRVLLGNLTLTKEDILGLDLLLDCYRQRESPCVTDSKEFILVTQRHNSHLVTIERFYDATGGVYRQNLNGVRGLSLFQYRLQRQLEKSKQ